MHLVELAEDYDGIKKEPLPMRRHAIHVLPHSERSAAAAS